MSILRVEIERFSLTSSRPLEAVVAALKAGIGRLDLAEFARVSKGPGTFADLKKVIERHLGRSGLILFLEMDHGAVLRKESGLNAPKSVRFIVGNPLIMKDLAKHVPHAGSYAPRTIMVDGRADVVHFCDDQMPTF